MFTQPSQSSFIVWISSPNNILLLKKRSVNAGHLGSLEWSQRNSFISSSSKRDCHVHDSLFYFVWKMTNITSSDAIDAILIYYAMTYTHFTPCGSIGKCALYEKKCSTVAFLSPATAFLQGGYFICSFLHPIFGCIVLI